MPVVSTALCRILRHYRDRRFVLVESGGNFGDELIYHGMDALAKEIGLECVSATYAEFMSARYPREWVVYVHGGGGYVPWWSGRPIHALGRALEEHSGVVILGPTTFHSDRAYLQETLRRDLDRRVSEEIFLFTREAVSHAAVSEIAGDDAHALLDHDTALNLTSSDLLQLAPGEGTRARRRYPLYAIREDKEWLDVGRFNPLRSPLDPIAFCRSFEHWLQLHLSARRIVTNRLHSAICGSVLGTPTTLLPNSYYKNRGVWELSLKERGVQWQDAMPVGEMTRLLFGLTRRLIGRGSIRPGPALSVLREGRSPSAKVVGPSSRPRVSTVGAKRSAYHSVSTCSYARRGTSCLRSPRPRRKGSSPSGEEPRSSHHAKKFGDGGSEGVLARGRPGAHRTSCDRAEGARSVEELRVDSNNVAH